jgi:hypothetical protein
VGPGGRERGERDEWGGLVRPDSAADDLGPGHGPGGLLSSFSFLF